jgi:hypothetical protein
MNTQNTQIGVKVALGLLGQAATLHTFSDSAMFAGCDVSRQQLAQGIIDNYGAAIVDPDHPMAGVGHPLRVKTELGAVFVEIDPDRLKEFGLNHPSEEEELAAAYQRAPWCFEGEDDYEYGPECPYYGE